MTNSNASLVDETTTTNPTTDSMMPDGPHQIHLLAPPPTTSLSWYTFCRSHNIDMGAAHLLCREVERNGSAILGTWPTREEARVVETVLRVEVYKQDDKDGDEGEECVKCVPAPMNGGGKVQAPSKTKDGNEVSNGDAAASAGEPDKKKAKFASASSIPPSPSASASPTSDPQTKEVNPEIQRLYDEGIITSAEFDQMQQADQLFEAEVQTAPTTFAVHKFPSSLHNQQNLPPALKFDYNHGRRPDIYDAYAHRHNPAFWVNPRLYKANVTTLSPMCLVEFCRKYTVPKRGPSEGKIKYHRKGVITKKLQFHPEYSSDPSFEGGRDYGKYCRFALVRYRPWVDAPFGRVESSTAAGSTADGDGKQRAEYKPEEDECIRQWAQYLLELKERMHLIPDVLLPEELKGGGAGIELLVVPDVERADEVEQRTTADVTAMVEGMVDEKKVDDVQTLDEVIRAAEEAIGSRPDTNADAAVVSDDDDDDDSDDAVEQEVEDENKDNVQPSPFADMEDAVASTAGEDVAACDDDNPFASFVSNKMSGDAEEDNWLSSVMAAGAVTADTAAERSVNTEMSAGAAEADTAVAEEDNAADDASLESIGKMFDDAKKGLSGVMSEPSDSEADEAPEVASIAASDDSSQIEEMYNDFSADDDDNVPREEIDLAPSTSSVKEELDEVDAEAKDAATTRLQSAWRGHSARKSAPSAPDDTKPTSEVKIEAEVEKEGGAEAPVVTPKKNPTPSALTLKLEQSGATSSTKPEGSASIGTSVTSPRSKPRASESLQFLAENTSSNFVSPRKRELEELRNLVKGRATEGKERLESDAGQHSDEQSRIEELRSQAHADLHKINEIRQAKKIKTACSALLIQSAWRRHKAQEAFIQQRAAIRENIAQEESAAAVAIQSAARGYNDRRQYIALLNGFVALQAIARGSQARATSIHPTEEAEPNVEDFHDAATAEHGNANLTNEYCPSNASVGDYFTAAEDEEVKLARKKKSVGPSKKLFGIRKSSRAAGYAEMMASDSDPEDEIEAIRQRTSFLGRKSLKADEYYAEMLVDDYVLESDGEIAASPPVRYNRSASPAKRRLKKMNDKEKDGRQMSVVGSFMRKNKKANKTKSVVADIVGDKDTTGSILLSARVLTTKPKPKPKPKGKKSRRKKNKTRGVRETGPEEPEFWQGFAVDMEESDIESDLEDDVGSLQSSRQRKSAPQIFDCRTIEEESFDEEEDFFASTTPRAQVDLSKDAVPENATTVTTEEFSNYVSNRFEFPEDPLVFKPDTRQQNSGGEKKPSFNADDNGNGGAEEPVGVEVKASDEDEAIPATADKGPGPLTQAAVMDSANIFPMENFRRDAILADEKDPSSADDIAPSASGEIEVQVGDSPREVSAGDILVDLETTLKDEDVTVAVSTNTSGISKLKSLRKKTKTSKKSKAPVQAADFDGGLLLNTESSAAMNFGQIVSEEEDYPSGTPVNISIDSSIFEGVEVSMDSIEPIAIYGKSNDSAPGPIPASEPASTTHIIADEEEEMPVIAPSTITATRFRVRSLGRTYSTTDDVEL